MDGKPPTYEELLDLNRRQARQIDELRAEVERLKAELEQSRRAGKRQAAPFSTNRCAKRATSHRPQVWLGHRRTGSTPALAGGDRPRGGTPGATPPGPGT